MKTDTKAAPKSSPKERKTVQFVIADPNGQWFRFCQKIIAENEHLLAPDEKTPQNLVRMLIRNAHICIPVIKSSKE